MKQHLWYLLICRDAEGEKLFRALERSQKEHEDIQIKIEALTIMQTGDYKAPIQREKTIIEGEIKIHLKENCYLTQFWKGL